MSFKGESQNPNREFDSTREWLLRDDLGEVISIYADHFVPVNEGNSELGIPAEILLGGQTDGDKIDSLIDISLTLRVVDGQRIATISAGGESYAISDDAVWHANDPSQEVIGDDIDEIRLWLSPATTWDKNHSARIVSYLHAPADMDEELQDLLDFEGAGAEAPTIASRIVSAIKSCFDRRR